MLDLNLVERFYIQISKDIDKISFENEDEEIKESQRERKYPVSKLVFGCPRMIYYYFQTQYPTIDLKGSVRVWIGKKLHQTKILGDDCHQELKLTYNKLIGVIDEYKDGFLLEKKTISHIPSGPLEHHIKQVEYYAYLLKKNNFPVIKASILYIDIYDLDVVSYEVKLREMNIIENEVEGICMELEKYFSTSQLPPRKMQTWPNSKNLKCHYCEFFGRCIRE